jgi:hypothetical protein
MAAADDDDDEIDEYSSDEEGRSSRKVLHIDAKGHRSSVDSSGLASPIKSKNSKSRSNFVAGGPEVQVADTTASAVEVRTALKSVANENTPAANSSRNVKKHTASSSSSSQNVNDVLMRNSKALASSQSSQCSQPSPDKAIAARRPDGVSSTGLMEDATHGPKPPKGQKPISNFFSKATRAKKNELIRCLEDKGESCAR